MNVKFKKAAADLLTAPWRSALVVIALAIGLWGLGSLIVSTVILRNDLRENFLMTSPPHAVLTSDDFKRLDLEEFRKRPEVESAAFRDLSIKRIEVRPDEWIPVWLFGVEDFESFRLARFYGRSGLKRPEPGSMLIERDGMLISDLAVGSRARVRSGDRLMEVPVGGISFDPAQAPATQDHFIYAYMDKRSYAEVSGESPNGRLIYRLKGAKTRDEVKAETVRIIAYLESLGIAVKTVNVPKFEEHPHQWQLNTLMLLQASIALLAFLMGAALVSQLMDAILASQVRQIGILKAIGATRVEVLKIYMIMVLLFGAAAAVIALPLSVATGFAFARFVAAKLNFEVLTASLPARVYIIYLAAAVFVPVLLSLPALMRGIRVSVLEALSDYGIARPGKRGIDRAALRLPAPTTVALAFRNTLRRKRRLFVTVLTMAIGVAIFATGFNVRESLRALLTDVRDSMRHDVQVVLGKSADRGLALAPFKAIGNVERVETWNGGKGALQSGVVAADDGVGVVALPHDSALSRLKVEKGRWLSGSNGPEAVLNQQAMEAYGNPAVGGSMALKLGGRRIDVMVVGVVWELDKPKIYMDQRVYDALVNPDHLVNSLMFVAKDKRYEKVFEMKKEIERAIAGSDLDVLYVMSQAERVKVIYDHLDIILTTIVLLALAVLVVGAIGMTSATGINVMERTREIGVMRAIGASPATVYRLFATEGMITSAVSVVLGLALSWPLSMAAAPFFGSLMLGEGALLRFAFSHEGFLITLGATMAFGWLAGRIPARRAVKVSTREALAYE